MWGDDYQKRTGKAPRKQRRCGLCRGLGHRRETCTASNTGQSAEETRPRTPEETAALLASAERRERVDRVQRERGDIAKMRARIGLPT